MSTFCEQTKSTGLQGQSEKCWECLGEGWVVLRHPGLYSAASPTVIPITTWPQRCLEGTMVAFPEVPVVDVVVVVEDTALGSTSIQV